MISHQTLGQIEGLTRQGVNRAFYNEKLQEIPRGYRETHSLPWPSSVADPSHSPIERGQRHGPGERACRWLRLVVVSCCSGSYGIGNGDLGIIFLKGRSLCFGFKIYLEVLTRGLIISLRGLNG
jgi:hypothetical protein